LSAAQAGYVLVAALWVVILTPVVAGLVRFIRTTKPADLIPRIVRVSRRRPVTVVSGLRASHEPAMFEPFTPWTWRRRE